MGVRAIPSSVARDPYHDHDTDGSVRAFGGTETVDNLPASPPPFQLAVPDGIAGDPRYGCAYVGPTLHRAGDPLDADARK